MQPWQSRVLNFAFGSRGDVLILRLAFRGAKGDFLFNFKLIVIWLCLSGLVCAQSGRSESEAVWLDAKVVSESSGLARSRIDDRLLWTHNDSVTKPGCLPSMPLANSTLKLKSKKRTL